MYSKGPLRISGPSQGKGPNDDGGNYAIVEPGGIIIGEAFRCVGEDAIRDAEANARLWALVPDLLAALEAALNWLEHARTSGALRRANGYEPVIDQARAALAGARGAEGER